MDTIKKTFIIIVIVFCAFNVLEAQDSTIIIYPGKGVKGIIIDSTSIDSVFKLYGEKKIEKVFFRHHRSKSHYYKYQNNDIGLSIYGGTDKIIYKLIMRWPFNGKTLKGVEIGKSTMEDIIEGYGTEYREYDIVINDNWEGMSYYSFPFFRKYYTAFSFKNQKWIEDLGKYKHVFYSKLGISFIIQLRNDSDSNKGFLNNKVVNIIVDQKIILVED